MSTPPLLDGDLDPSRPEAYESRDEFRARVREEAPVVYSERLGFWVVARFDDVLEVVRSPDLFGKKQGRSSLQPLSPANERRLQRFTDEFAATLERDPPEHTFYRRKVLPMFMAPKMRARHPVLCRIANDLIDGFEDAGAADAIAADSFPLPAIHTFEMIGVPPEEIARVRDLSLSYLDLRYGVNLSEAEQALAVDRTLEYWDFLKELAASRRRQPTGDIVSELVTTTSEDEERLLDICEVASLTSQIVVGAHRTTTNLIGNVLQALLADPTLWRRVVDDPGLAQVAVDESLRRDAPATGIFYVARQEAVIAGVTIPRGALVYPVFGSANHDPAHFQHPEAFDLDRQDRDPHLAFGAATHLCPGKALGRVSGAAAVETIAARLPSLRLAGGIAPHLPAFTTNGFEQLHVEWDV